MVEIRRTDVFDGWLRSVRDLRARAKIEIRIDRLAGGNAGDVRPVGSGISELRIDHGPGYRVYFCQRRQLIVILLCGGDKRSQQADIRTAKLLAGRLGD